MRGVKLVSAAAALLVGCTVVPISDGAIGQGIFGDEDRGYSRRDLEGRELSFSCKGGKQFRVYFDRDAERAEVDTGRQTYDLDYIEREGDLYRYAGRGGGQKARLDVEGRNGYLELEGESDYADCKSGGGGSFASGGGFGGRSDVINFRCDNDKSFTASFRRGNESVVVEAGDQRVDMNYDGRDGDLRYYEGRSPGGRDLRLDIDSRGNAYIHVEDGGDFEDCKARR